MSPLLRSLVFMALLWQCHARALNDVTYASSNYGPPKSDVAQDTQATMEDVKPLQVVVQLANTTPEFIEKVANGSSNIGAPTINHRMLGGGRHKPPSGLPP